MVENDTNQLQTMIESFTQFDRATRVEICRPREDGVWTTSIDFPRRDTGKIDTVQFESSGRFIQFYDLLMGFDSVSIEDRNTGGNTLEFGRFELQVWVDDNCTKCDVDRFSIVSRCLDTALAKNEAEPQR